MTLDLGPIKERAERATKGPWKHLSLGVKLERAEAVGRTHVAATHNQERIVTRHDGGTTPSFDADFIAEARADIPALVAEVEALRAALGAERDLVDEARAFVHRATLSQYGVSDPRCNRETAEAWLDRRLDRRRAPKIGGGE